MTAPREFDRDVRAFLEDGPAELSDRTYDAVRAGIDGTRQRVVIGPWRTTDVNTFLKLAAGAAAVLAVAVVGANLLGSNPGPGAAPSPTSTTISSPSPTVTPVTPGPTAPAPTATLRPGELPASGSLGPGTYAFYGNAEGRTVRVDFSGAAGWISGGWYITTPDEAGPQAALAAWGFGRTTRGVPVDGFTLEDGQRIELVPADPCHPDDATASVGGTVDDLVAAMLAQGLRTSEPPIDVSISGYTGKLIDSTVEVVDVLSCDNRELELWVLATGQSRWVVESMVQRLIVLDVDGIRVLLEGSYRVGGPANQLLAIMDTIQITVE